MDQGKCEEVTPNRFGTASPFGPLLRFIEQKKHNDPFHEVRERSIQTFTFNFKR
jgi:hypothetical protein